MDMEKGRADFVLLFPFFVVKEELWSENVCKKTQKKIIPAVPFDSIISLACLSSPDRILNLPDFRETALIPYSRYYQLFTCSVISLGLTPLPSFHKRKRMLFTSCE